jgi:hypothetical protein
MDIIRHLLYRGGLLDLQSLRHLLYMLSYSGSLGLDYRWCEMLSPGELLLRLGCLQYCN